MILSSSLLSTAQGSLLDDEQLVNTLHTSKITSSEVSEQLQTSEQTEIKIDTAREVCFAIMTMLFSLPTKKPRLFELNTWRAECNLIIFSVNSTF